MAIGSDDITVQILIDIRDEMRSTRGEVRSAKDEIRSTREELSKRIDATNARLDATNTHLDAVESRVIDSDLRQATAMAGLTAATRDVYALLGDRFDLRDRVERCERDIDELKRRVG